MDVNELYVYLCFIHKVKINFIMALKDLGFCASHKSNTCTILVLSMSIYIQGYVIILMHYYIKGVE
jgi:hypothetical protein